MLTSEIQFFCVPNFRISPGYLKLRDGQRISMCFPAQSLALLSVDVYTELPLTRHSVNFSYHWISSYHSILNLYSGTVRQVPWMESNSIEKLARKRSTIKKSINAQYTTDNSISIADICRQVSRLEKLRALLKEHSSRKFPFELGL